VSIKEQSEKEKEAKMRAEEAPVYKDLVCAFFSCRLSNKTFMSAYLTQ